MIIAAHQQQIIGFLFIKENLFNRAVEKMQTQGVPPGMGQGIAQNQVMTDMNQQQRLQQMQFLNQQQMNMQGQPQNMFALHQQQQQQQQLMGMQGQQQAFIGMQGGQLPGQMQGVQMQQLTPQQRMVMLQQQQQQQRQGNQRM